MLRATVWTVGLFGAGTAICRAYPATWTEPLVLFALGLVLLYVSARTARTTQREAQARTAAAALPAPTPKPKPKSAPMPAPVPATAAPVQVEQTI